MKIVEDLPPTINLEVGDSQELKVSVSGAKVPVSSQWELDGKVIDSFTHENESPNHLFSYLINATKPLTGAVSCKITDGSGQVAQSSVANITIKDKAENG